MKKLLYIILFVPVVLFGQDDYSLSFDGIDDYVSLPQLQPSVLETGGSSTLVISYKGYGALFAGSVATAPVNPIIYRVEVNNLADNYAEIKTYHRSVNLSEVNQEPTSESFIYDGNSWKTLIVSIDNLNGVYTLYNNGQVLLDYTFSPSNFNDPSLVWQIGHFSYVGGGTNFFNGYIDDVKIFDNYFSISDVNNYLDQCISDSSNLVYNSDFNEGSGNILNDLSGNGNHGVIHGATFSEDVPEQNCDVNTDIETVDEEQQNYSLSFDDVNDYVIVDNPIYSAEEFSLNCWVKFSQSGPNENGNLIANWSMDPGGAYLLYYSSYQGNQTISAIVGGDEETVYLETPLQSGDFNTWNFISLTYDGTHSKLYINGDLRDSLYGEFGTIEGSNIATFGVEENYNFGQGVNAHYGGLMDEISIWNKSLSNQEIQSYMSCPPTGHEESLVGYWKINEISSNIIYDASVNENHGIIYGGATLSEDVPEQNCDVNADTDTVEQVNDSLVISCIRIIDLHLDHSAGGGYLNEGISLILPDGVIEEYCDGSCSTGNWTPVNHQPYVQCQNMANTIQEFSSYFDAECVSQDTLRIITKDYYEESPYLEVSNCGNCGIWSVNGVTNPQEPIPFDCDINTDIETVEEEQQNYSMSFDGVDDYIDIGLPNGFNPSGSHTFMFYEKHFSTDGCNSLGMIISEYGYAQTSQGLHYGYRACEANCPLGNCFGVDFYNNNIYTESINDLTWKHWAISYNHLTYERSIYLNGDLVANDFSNNIAYAGPFDLIFGATQFLDSQPSIMGSHFSGQLDEITLWNKELSIEEVQSNITCPPIPNQEELIGYWNFNEGSGDTVYDISGNNNHGLINGASFSEDVPENNCNESDDDINISLYEIGDFAEGGIVFYTDETGTRGLAASMSDINPQVFGCYGQYIEGATGIAIGTGYQNTIEIDEGCTETPNASNQALDYQFEDYDNWFLPSQAELILMYNNIGNGSALGNIGDFNSAYYWSSTQYGYGSGYDLDFTNGISCENCYDNNYSTISRPIRAFGNWTMGCMDETACNYNAEANMADGSCTYAEQVYDCDGNLTAEIEEPICGYLRTAIDVWPYVDITIPDGYKVHSVYADFDRPGYYGSQLDFSIAYCSNCDLFPAFNDNLTDFLIWNYDTIPYSLYHTELVISEVSEIELNGPGTIRVLSPLPNDGWNDFCVTFKQLIYGCMDSLACNYNAEANTTDGSCTYPELFYDCSGELIPVLGCMSDWADNYNPDANTNDGSCDRLGCMSDWSDNYDDLATTDDGSCYRLGCLYDWALNYDLLATIDDGSCEPVILGCTYPYSTNFNINANLDDGSCLVECCMNQYDQICDPLATIDYPCFREGCMSDWADNYDVLATQNTLIENECYRMGCMSDLADNFDDLATSDDGSCYRMGCMSDWANNYDVLATTDDGSCYREGCMLDWADNYDDLATQNNLIADICFREGCMVDYMDNYDLLASQDSEDICYREGCTSEWADNYDELATTDDGSCDIACCIDPWDPWYDELCTTHDESLCVRLGCMSEWADNYDELVTNDDGSCYRMGCMSEWADNYDELVTNDDGSCYRMGCMSDWADNYDALATDDDGSCFKLGCTDIEAYNYDPLATNTDDSCIAYIFGCTDPYSYNYDSSANTDNDNCISWNSIVTNLESEIIQMNLQVSELNNSVNELSNDLQISNLDILIAEDSIIYLNSFLNQVNQNVISLNNIIEIAYSDISNLEDSLSIAMSNQEDGITQVDIDLLQVQLDSANFNISELNTLLSNSVSDVNDLEEQLSIALENQIVPIYIDIYTGWNMVGFSCPDEKNAEEALINIVDKIIIFKDNGGNVYMPEFSFNGIGDLTPGHGYQLKVTDSILEFNICD